MAKAEAIVVNTLGLHARPSARLTKLAGQFKSEVWLSRNQRRINAKSIMGVMMLAAGKGAKVEIETIGEDEQPALQALVDFFADGFGEN